MNLLIYLVLALLIYGCGKSNTPERTDRPVSGAPIADSATTDTTHSKLYPGKPFPAIDVLDLDERAVNAASLVMGKPSLVIFVDPDCEACQEFMAVWKPRVGELPKGLNVVGITKVDAQYAKQYKADSGFPFPLYSDAAGIFARDYRIKVYPTVVGTYPDGGVAFVGKAVTPEFTPQKAASLLAQALAARAKREGH